MRQRALPRGYEEVRLLAALSEEGCPICHDVGRGDDAYFFWFFNEHYYEVFTLDGLTRSLGFCLTHGARLTRAAVGPYQLALVHEILVRRIRAILSNRPGYTRGGPPASALATYDVCWACRDRRERVARTVVDVARLLEDPDGIDRYAHPGVLCFPHLGAVAPRVSARTLDRLLTIHQAAMAAAIRSLGELRAELYRISSDERQDPIKALLPSLRLAVGHDPGNGPYPSLDGLAVSRQPRDPVGDFLEGIRQAQACPVCLEVRRAWMEWIGWLRDTIQPVVDVDDLLPTCPEHVWPTVHQGGSFLAVATAEKALSTALGEVRTAFQFLKPPPSPNRERVMLRVRNALRGPSLRLKAAREALGRPPQCPVCERLTVARDRSLLLLFTLLEDPQHWAVVKNGYGLCLKHFSRALALVPPPAVRTVLVEVEAAKLACLQWELEELLRKVAWHVRPEAKGTEQMAWRRAVLRFSGSLTEAG